MEFAPPDTLFHEIIRFIGSGPSVEEILAYQPSEKLSQRLHELLDKNKEDALSEDEVKELDEFLRMNHLLKMIKIQARLTQMGKA